MAPDKREWTVPAPLRTLLWWPPTAFVLVMVAPEAAAGSIAAAGAVLVGLGALASAVSRRLRRAAVGAAPAAAGPAQDPPTVEMPTIEIPPVRRAA
jgi:hypothetical protein